MPTGFVATQFSVIEEHGVLVTSLGAPSTEDDDFYLMLQHTESRTEQDVRFGMDKPYIEYCGQGWSWYGHIERFELFPNRVVVRMNEAAAAHMQNDGVISVEFQLEEHQFARLRQALERTFHGCPYFATKV